AEFKPEQIWLFGSYAWGEPTSDSDLDFLVVVPESDAHPLDRMQRAHRCLRGVRTPMDVLVPTKEEFERVRNVRPSLTYKIVREGMLVYG
ncbi:MAG: nucleotidyltransferase domain-containing protein, partial [Chthoniobacteraceae bacterium]